MAEGHSVLRKSCLECSRLHSGDVTNQVGKPILRKDYPPVMEKRFGAIGRGHR